MYIPPWREKKNCLKLPRVHEDGGAGGRLGPVAERAVAVPVREALDAPEVLGAEPRPVRHAGAERVAGGQLGGHDARAGAPRRVVRVAAERGGQPRRVGPGAAQPVQEVDAEGPEQVGHGRHAGEPGRQRAVGGARGASRRPPQPRRPAHLEPERVLAVPHAAHRPRRRRRRQERLGPAAAAGPRARVRDRQERAERQRVAQHGVDVAREELHAREPRAVEQLGVAGAQPDHRGAARRGQVVPEHRVRQHGRGAELGVPAAGGEEPHRGLVGAVGRHVRVLRARLPEPLLHPRHQRARHAAAPVSRRHAQAQQVAHLGEELELVVPPARHGLHAPAHHAHDLAARAGLGNLRQAAKASTETVRFSDRDRSIDHARITMVRGGRQDNNVRA
jgi:hypothetical protein